MMIFHYFPRKREKSNNVGNNDERVEKKKTRTITFALESFLRPLFSSEALGVSWKRYFRTLSSFRHFTNFGFLSLLSNHFIQLIIIRPLVMEIGRV